MLVFESNNNFGKYNKYEKIHENINSVSRQLKRRAPPKLFQQKKNKISLNKNNKLFLKSLGFQLINDE